MDQVDKAILNQIQKHFPLCPRPFAALGRQFGLSERDALERVCRLKDQRIIRRIGGVFDTNKLGFVSTLAAAKVHPERLEVVAQTVNCFPGVTHNYQRDHAYNLWFTVTASSDKDIDAFLEQVQSLEGVEYLMKLPAEKVYKIELNLPVE